MHDRILLRVNAVARLIKHLVRVEMTMQQLPKLHHGQYFGSEHAKNAISPNCIGSLFADSLKLEINLITERRLVNAVQELSIRKVKDLTADHIGITSQCGVSNSLSVTLLPYQI